MPRRAALCAACCVLCLQARLAAYQEALSELVMYKSRIDVAVLQVGHISIKIKYKNNKTSLGSIAWLAHRAKPKK
jgi:hypothetical protein